jgi:Tfp pilus assembly protein PilE
MKPNQNPITMTRRFLALVVTAVLAVGAASAQNQSWGPYPASEVKAFLEKNPQFQSAFRADAKGNLACTDSHAAKAFEATRSTVPTGPIATESAIENERSTSIVPQPVRRETAQPEAPGKMDYNAIRARIAAIEAELQARPVNSKALIAERESLLGRIQQRAPATR